MVPVGCAGRTFEVVDGAHSTRTALGYVPLSTVERGQGEAPEGRTNRQAEATTSPYSCQECVTSSGAAPGAGCHQDAGRRCSSGGWRRRCPAGGPRRPSRSAHRLLEPVVGDVAGVHAAALELRLGPPLADDAGVVVRGRTRPQTGERLPRLRRRRGRALRRTDRSAPAAGSRAPPGCRGRPPAHVEADALGLRRVVQQAVALGLLERAGTASGERVFNSNCMAPPCAATIIVRRAAEHAEQPASPGS